MAGRVTVTGQLSGVTIDHIVTAGEFKTISKFLLQPIEKVN
jgi:hypothetical protein